MRIMLVCGSLPPAKPVCGVANSLVQIAKTLLDKGVSVAIVTNEQSKTSVVGGTGKVAEVFPIMKGWGFREIPAFWAKVEEWRPDLVHIQYPTHGYGRSWMPYFLPLILKWGGKTVVQTWHEHTRYRFFPNAMTRDTLIVVEPDFLGKVRRRYRWLVRRKNIHFIQVVSNIPPVRLSDEERRDIRSRWLINGTHLVAYFGFVYPGKGLEAVFDIADSTEDTILIVGEMDFENNAYHKSFLSTIEGSRWRGTAVVTGFVDAAEVAKLLAAADAVLCPFERGVRRNNGTFLAAMAQGTFVVTTATNRKGYDAKENVYYAAPGAISHMKRALKQYKGTRLAESHPDVTDLNRFTNDHIAVYEAALAHKRYSVEIGSGEDE